MYFLQKTLTRFHNLGYTYFLNPSELKQVSSKLKKSDYSIYKPYPDSEKNILYHGECPEVLLYEIVCKSPLRHQDILGTMYSLNIASDLFGDVLVIDHHYYVYILPIVQNYFDTNLLKIKNSHVSLKEIPLSTLENYERSYEEVECISSSIRMDAVIASLLHISRKNVLDLLQKKEVQYNYEILNDPSIKLKEGDVFSIRRVGKYQYVGVLKSTKRSNFILSFKKY